MTNARIHSFFDEPTFTATHVVSCPVTRAAAVIDSVLDFDPKSGRTSTQAADKVLACVRANDLKVQWHLETHAHADHLSAAPYLKERVGGLIGIGVHIQACLQENLQCQGHEHRWHAVRPSLRGR